MISVPMAADRAYIHTKSSVLVFGNAIFSSESSIAHFDGSLSFSKAWACSSAWRQGKEGKESIQQ
jgi:hypothetical protein